ncbi:hypothetical protein LINPERHAP2_LOCUS5021 [Linum perenne]
MAPGVSKKKNKSTFGDYLSQGHDASLITRSPIEGLDTSSISPAMASGSYQGKQKDLPSMFNVKGASLSRTKTLYQAWKDTVDEMENPSTPNHSTPSPHTPHLTTTTVQTQSNGTSTPSVTSQSATEDELEDRIDPGFEDDLEENVDLSSKAVRGMTRGLSLHKQFKRTGKKKEVFIDRNDGRALETHQSAAVANEIGQIAATYVWPIYKKKADKKAIFNVVMLKLQVKLDIKNISDISVREKLWKHFLKIVKGRRAAYHKSFKKHGDQQKPDCLSDDMWRNLCAHWKKEIVQLKMKELWNETVESEEPMTAKEVMDEVLGHKSGYCKGIGYGPSIPSANRSHMESENAQLKELTSRMSKENSELSQQVKELKEAQAVFQKFMQDQLQKESESRED